MSRLSQSVKNRDGCVEELHVSDIVQNSNALRSGSSDKVDELMDSMRQIGLLSPIIVRPVIAGFEIVAGTRRFNACRKLGWKKIPSHILELDDKSAFEVSIIENVNRRTLSFIEEGLAFKKYVDEFGWGSITELADKLSKSPSYVSKRLKLLGLPKDVLDLISGSEISISMGEELLTIKEQVKQTKLAQLTIARSLTTKKLRSIINDQEGEVYLNNKSYISETDEKERNIVKIFEESIISLRIAANKLAVTIEKVQNEWIVFELLMHHKNIISSQIDLLIREKKKFVKA
ncbi:MAG TPA: ParB/RepB/Spo0J family partition protein, partial [Nitrososphaeraceae archaeon]